MVDRIKHASSAPYNSLPKSHSQSWPVLKSFTISNNLSVCSFIEQKSPVRSLSTILTSNLQTTTYQEIQEDVRIYEELLHLYHLSWSWSPFLWNFGWWQERSPMSQGTPRAIHSSARSLSIVLVMDSMGSMAPYKLPARKSTMHALRSYLLRTHLT